MISKKEECQRFFSLILLYFRTHLLSLAMTIEENEPVSNFLLTNSLDSMFCCRDVREK